MIANTSHDQAGGQPIMDVDRYLVVGHPIAHSKSPEIHAAFAKATGHALHYDRLLAPLDGFADAVRSFAAAGGRGMNVTVPFKLEAHALADTLTPRAAAAGAVNTLRFLREGDTVRIEGDNTDGAGLVQDIEINLGCPFAGKRVLLLGAGGAARGVILPILERGPRQLHIANRTLQRAHALRDHFAADAVARYVVLEALEASQLLPFDAAVVPSASDRSPASMTGATEAGTAAALDVASASAARYDIVINGTSSSLGGALPDLPAGAIGAGTLVYDMMYGAALTPFLLASRAAGADIADGLGMLVEQAAESFLSWRGVRPDGRPVLTALRARLKG
ncbi:shikimate dehydrogenase [Robbsia andropogonis]|uniref:shikimate dehydrogenase n=1 Tax=Robbsia andropogonis TaxID=28092 RepID=UPI00209F7EDD|nr:shikimate dehydrogenase [Robbsia andropogonis]MCP1118325.1 shikimate dehydrogenase [Robbsia andropogonis]MCP1127897.1 shikimate dehydrogenase [Robbsia andropogonis]